MPTYQYRCDKCGKEFERSETISEHEALKPKCRKCGSKKVSQMPGATLPMQLFEDDLEAPRARRGRSGAL
jgi:putative FmdB family regulatory protein